MVAATISLYGDQMSTIALLVLLYQVTGRIQAPAAYLLAKQLPRLIGAGPGGAMADRFSPQLVVRVCALVQAGAVGLIIPAGRAGSAVLIYALVLLGQLAAGMSRAAMGAVLPRVVPAESLGRANALLQLAQATAFVGGPLIGAPLLAASGPNLLLAVDVITFLASALLLARMPTTISGTPGGRLHGPGMLSGLRTVAGDPLLRTLAAAYIAEGICVNLAAAVFVILAAERLGGDGAVGLLYLAVGLGDAAGALIALRIQPRHIGPRQIALPGALAVAAVAFLALAHSWWQAAIPLVVCGLASILYQTWGTAEAQTITGREVMGRVSGTMLLAQSSGLLVGAAAQVLVLSYVRWDVALPVGCVATAAALAVTGLATSAGRRPEAALPAPTGG